MAKAPAKAPDDGLVRTGYRYNVIFSEEQDALLRKEAYDCRVAISRIVREAVAGYFKLPPDKRRRDVAA